MLIARVGTAIIAVPLVLILIWIGGAPFVLASVIVAGVASGEASQLLGVPTGSIWSILAVVSAGLVVAAGAGGTTAILATLAAILLASQVAFLALPGGGSIATTEWSRGLLAALYAGLPLSLLVRIRAWGSTNVANPHPSLTFDHGGQWALLTITTVWIADTAAYAAGRLIGRRPLWPRVSPKKTWEGTIAAVVAGGLAGWGWAALVGQSPLFLTAIGLLIGAAAVIGDLVESAIKRAADVKDSSSLIPGHGGMLDRTDSLSFAATVVFLIGAVLGLGGQPA